MTTVGGALGPGPRSRQQVVNLGPYLSNVVIVGTVNLPACPGRFFAAGRTPVKDRSVCVSQCRIRSAMRSRRYSPGRQDRCRHPSRERAWVGELDTDLHTWPVVDVEHHVAATRRDPAGPQARPYFVQQFPPQRRELAPRRGGRDHQRWPLDHNDLPDLVPHRRFGPTIGCVSATERGYAPAAHPASGSKPTVPQDRATDYSATGARSRSRSGRSLKQVRRRWQHIIEKRTHHWRQDR